jgi:hypothetical protein
VAQDVVSVLGHDLAPVTGRDMYQGGSDRSYAWLYSDGPDDLEPSRSHPFDLDLATPHDPEVPFANAVFDRLAELGRYRLILIIEDACVRSTHFPCEQW